MDMAMALSGIDLKWEGIERIGNCSRFSMEMGQPRGENG
jgi:hypothetical protein